MRKLDDNPSDFLCSHYIKLFFFTFPVWQDNLTWLYNFSCCEHVYTKVFTVQKKIKKSDFRYFSCCDHVYSRSLHFAGKYTKINQISRPKKIFLATETIFITSPRIHVNNNCVTIFSAVRNLNNPLVLDSKKKIVNFYERKVEISKVYRLFIQNA